MSARAREARQAGRRGRGDVGEAKGEPCELLLEEANLCQWSKAIDNGSNH